MVIFPLGVLGARGLRVVTARWWWAHGGPDAKSLEDAVDTICSRVAGYLWLRMHRGGICAVSAS